MYRRFKRLSYAEAGQDVRMWERLGIWTIIAFNF